MLSIIIPVYNNHHLTKECLRSIQDYTEKEVDYEIIIIDNGSVPPVATTELEAIGRPYALIRNEENLGFPKAVNAGILTSIGDILLILNNDVVLTPGWTKMLKHLDQGFDIVGPMSNYCCGFQQMWEEIYGPVYVARYKDVIQEVTFITGFCMVIKKKVFNEIGKFDETMWPCCGEEIDFCFRAKKHGFKIGIARDVCVHHEGSQTFALLDENVDQIARRNDVYLKEKWGVDPWINQKIICTSGLNLNLGCGVRRRTGYVNIDNRAEVFPDMLCDVTEGLPYDDNSVDEVRAFDFLEHIPSNKTIRVIEEIYRVLKPGGLLETLTPDAEFGQAAFQDPTHKSFWVENSWLYFTNSEFRDLYQIKTDFHFRILKRVKTDNLRMFHMYVVVEARK